ncbi:MAG: electron transfer flavoprotein subunit beta/FixA family protein [Treponema sp.]|jgi:electron transfer flavoprotein beta subunit|nr:electron transfer flavoprotein subunit beta/FixA family protein [Treponema sp.]
MKDDTAFPETGLKILVPVKQVPESGNVKMDPATGTMIRSGVENVVNPLDLYAIETAIRLKEKYGGEVTAISMGPPAAMRVLREAAAMGCDRCALLSDKRFGGADTWATSYTLSRGAARLGSFDVIVAGERATDGDTAQVGPALAAWLDIPALTYVSKIEKIERGRIMAERLVEEGYELLDAPLPCLVTVVKEIAVPRLPTLRGKIRSREMEIPVFSVDDLDVDPAYIGLKGSPTRVVKIETPSVSRGGRTIVASDEDSIRYALDELMALLTEKGLV